MKDSYPDPAPGCRDVVVLSGGGASGAAQVGMLQVLLEHGIRPAAFVGTSVGALNASAIAYDATPDRARWLGERWIGLRGRDIFAERVFGKAAHLIRRHPYLYSPRNLARLITDWAPGVTRLEDLATPVRVVTTDLSTGAPTYRDTGDLTRTLLASTALPAMFPPVELADQTTGATSLHVDGGVADLVPVSGAVGLCPTRVFVLDVTLSRSTRPARTPLDVLVASLGVAMRLRPFVDFGDDVTVHHLHTGDQLGRVEVGLTDFTRTPELIDLGRRAAEDMLAGCTGRLVSV